MNLKISNKLIKISASIIVLLLLGLGLLTAYNSYLPIEKNLFETIQRLAVTISIWAFVIVIYKLNKNPFSMTLYFVAGLFNLISPLVVYIDLSIAITYFAFAITIYFIFFK